MSAASFIYSWRLSEHPMTHCQSFWVVWISRCPFLLSHWGFTLYRMCACQIKINISVHEAFIFKSAQVWCNIILTFVSVHHTQFFLTYSKEPNFAIPLSNRTFCFSFLFFNKERKRFIGEWEKVLPWKHPPPPQSCRPQSSDRKSRFPRGD